MFVNNSLDKERFLYEISIYPAFYPLIRYGFPDTLIPLYFGSSMSNLIDRYLLFRVRTKRDPEAFAKIYDRYVKALYRFTLLKLPSKEEAQDVTAETFTKAWNYLQDHQQVTHARALLYQIARNLIADFYRNRPVSRGVDVVSLSVTDDLENTSPLIEDVSAQKDFGDSGREQRIIEARAELSLVRRQLKRLKEDYRDVVMLRLVDGLAFEDIAEVLEKSPGNVRVIYHRALKALKELE
jgi:RNA polymerase sigma-70 factor (ECF subfamily)